MDENRRLALLEGLALAAEAPWLGKMRVDRSPGEGPEAALKSLERALGVQARALLAHPEEDVGTGAEFAVLFGHCARYMQAEDAWLVYDKHEARWKREDRSGTLAMVKAAAQNRTPALGGGVRKVTYSHASQARASAKDALAATAEMFDRFPAALNTPEGVLDLDTGRVHPHCASMLLTMQTSAPLGAAPTPLWLDHLRRMTDGDGEQQKLLQMAAGLALYGGSDKPQQFIFLRGQGRNGKGVFLRTIRRALGPYAAIVSKGLFTQRDDAIPHEVLQLRGARAAFCLEAPRQTVNAASLNTLTGGDELRGRRLHGNLQGSFHPTFLPLWICGNESLSLDSHRNEALWERCVFVDVGAPIPSAERDDSVEPRLSAPDQLSGVVAWLLEGWHMFLGAGRRLPRTAQGDAYVAASKERGDSFGRWVRSGALVMEMGAEARMEDVADAYHQWCAARNEDPEDPLICVSALVGWNNVSTPAGEDTVARGVRLDRSAASSGFGALLGREAK